MDLVVLALAKKYTDDTFAGSGSLQGKDGKSAYQIALDNGFIGTEADWLESLKGEEGETGPQGDKGEIGASGEDGYSPSIAESNENTEDIYKLNIINKDNTITTPNLKGEDGSSGVYLGEEEPSDINIKVWIKPDGNANDGSGGSSEGGISVETLTHILKNYVTTEDYTASLKLKEDIENKVTSFELNFIDADNKKYPTIIALIDYLNKYYYNNSNIDEMIKSMQIDEEGYLTVTLPLLRDGETSGETLVIGKVSGKDGIDGKDGVDGENGQDGKDGVSCTHVWSGDTLIVTSASGTSSRNLKGEKGDKGDTGATGADGNDYVLTDTDKTEIANIVINEYDSSIMAILGGDNGVTE